MTSSKVPDQTRQIAGDLCGAGVRSIEPVQGGGNNRLFRIEDEDGQTFALKSYLLDNNDPRNRLHVETTAVKFLRGQGMDCVPAVLAVDAKKGFALFGWIEGETISSPTDANIEAALDFVKSLKMQTPAGAGLPDASEACLSGGEILRQLDARLKALLVTGAKAPDLSEFLEQAYKPVLAAAAGRAQQGYQRAGVPFDQDIAHSARTLSPSDFGFHNALKGAGGSIVFVDFEYFGWDDPVKLTADFLLHPAMTLSAAHKTRFRDTAQEIFGDDIFFAERLRLLFPLYGLRWCLILLNEFLPEKWSRRQFATSHTDYDQAKRRQLEKARTMLNGVRAELEKEA